MHEGRLDKQHRYLYYGGFIYVFSASSPHHTPLWIIRAAIELFLSVLQFIDDFIKKVPNSA